LEVFPVKMRNISFQYEKHTHLCPHGDVDFSNEVHFNFITHHEPPTQVEKFLDFHSL
jgi:hypothetical protein